MSNTVLTKETFRKIEAWVLTFGFTFYLITLLLNTRGNRNYGSWKFENFRIKYDFFENFFMPMLIIGATVYIALMIAILIIEPLYLRTRSIFKTAVSYFILFIFTFIIIAICNTYLDAWMFGELAKYDSLDQTYNKIFYDAFVLVFVFSAFYIGYFLLKLLIGNLIEISPESTSIKGIQYGKMGKYAAGFFVWLLGLFLFTISGSIPRIFAVIWAVIVPYSVIITTLNINWLIPQARGKAFNHSSYYLRAGAIILCISIMASAFISAVKNYNGPQFMIVLILILLWTALILTPWSWHVYNNLEEKTELETALGKSTANLSFLKAQINPHFLFNALNTLYGTALQENADRTSEGIQKLGDMMRFMLQENVQDKISLARDIDYINNYIDLQKLRISKTANINIETHIEEQHNSLMITPMILIPFIENAFKHGVSLNYPSHIKITLQTANTTLYLDVQNSVHEIKLNDPELHKSGIGLMNVKQRLALLYPNKHEFSIRENAKEFFIHLTLDLS